MAEPFRIAIAGLGTVGAGVVEIVQRHGDLLEARAGRRIEIVSVSARDASKDRGVDLSAYDWKENPQDSLENIDAVVEVIGGSDGPAYDLVKAALAKGISVVTANKALLALHGLELAQLAEKNGAVLAYEAAVAGCVPIIKGLREGLAANKMSAVYGILNGTCNYILTKMREEGGDFESVLKEAQEKGYAEADPSFDVDGIDAAHKLCILTAIAFGVQPDFDALHVRGIREISGTDINFASEFGYRIKLLGIAHDYDGKVSQSVEPCLVPVESPLGTIEDVYNAVFVEGDFVETPLFTGRGAGKGPTASAVVADIIDLARGHKIPAFGIPAASLKPYQDMDIGQTVHSWYIRLNVLDQPGVIADVSAILRDHRISIESLIQHGRDPEQPVAVVLTTHDARRSSIMEACKEIADLPSVQEKPCVMRIEEL